MKTFLIRDQARGSERETVDEESVNFINIFIILWRFFKYNLGYIQFLPVTLESV